MKKMLNAILLSLAMATWSSALQAQTCGSQPSCASLGYTLSSAANCVGTVLKCPFDTSKFYCTQKSDVTAALMPSYGGVLSRTCGTTYVAATDGYLMGAERFWDNWSNCKQFSGYHVKINGYNVRLYGGVFGNFVNTWLYPIKKGYQYSISCTSCKGGNYAEYSYVFVPLN